MREYVMTMLIVISFKNADKPDESFEWLHKALCASPGPKLIIDIEFACDEVPYRCFSTEFSSWKTYGKEKFSTLERIALPNIPDLFYGNHNISKLARRADI